MAPLIPIKTQLYSTTYDNYFTGKQEFTLKTESLQIAHYNLIYNTLDTLLNIYRPQSFVKQL